MPVTQAVAVPWTRKHDEPGVPLLVKVSSILNPKSLDELLEISEKRAPNVRLNTAGSHWALSRAAVSDRVFIDTHDPNDDPAHPAMGRTLYEVVPGCLTPGAPRCPLPTIGRRLDPVLPQNVRDGPSRDVVIQVG